MSYVNITALSFPEGAGPEIEQRFAQRAKGVDKAEGCLLYTSPSPRDATLSRMPSSA